VTKIGSGYTDEDLEELTKKFKSITRKEKPPEVRAELEPDHWIKPEYVFEIIYDEIQRSPPEKHTSGYGLRFPRFVKIREDIGFEGVDTVEDLERLFKKQEKS
ncbi:MAG: DNA ligase, partial [Hadesarchaea archaeon]|nr:DNA ligase [Hadesarchaea archaeon]